MTRTATPPLLQIPQIQQRQQQQQQQQQQHQRPKREPEPPPFPVKSGFLKGASGQTATTKTTSAKTRCRKVGSRCRFEGCTGRPWFAQPGSRIPKACKSHKAEGEVNIYTPACEAGGCGTRPHYGEEGQRARFCCKHKLDGMVDVLNKRCAAEGCRRQPSWARSIGARALFCKEHKDDDMVDIKHRRCLHPGCTRFPSKSGGATMPPATESQISSEIAGEQNAQVRTPSSAPRAVSAAATASAATPTAEATGPARYCAAHAPAGAVNVTASRCRYPGGCSVQPYFGREGGGQQAEFCALHRKRGMTDVRNPRCCAVGCAAQPRCGREGDPRPTFCLRHAEPDMVNFRSKGYREKALTKRSKLSEPYSVPSR